MSKRPWANNIDVISGVSGPGYTKRRQLAPEWRNMPGPHVSLAVFCEKVLTEADGVASLIRLIDRVGVVTGRPGASNELPKALVPVVLAIGFKAGDAKGRYPLRIEIEEPSGRTAPGPSMDLLFESDDRGNNVFIEMQLDAIEGLYWFKVHIDDIEKTRVPLRIIYQRIQTAG